MANITDVKLPDNSQYDLKDNVSGYAKKVAGATTDDLASLTATGDLADSGKKLSDLVLKSDVKDVLNSTSTTDPLSANMGRALADNLAANENVYGAKNRITYPYEDTTKTDNGITFTDNGDGTVTVSGTASGSAFFNLHDSIGRPYLENGKYTLSGCPQFGGTQQMRLYIVYANPDDNTSVFIDQYNTDEETAFTINGSYGDTKGAKCSLYISIVSGTVISTPITFKPMIRDARIVDDTFVPYAMTNRQLTDTVNEEDISSQLTVNTTYFNVGGLGEEIKCIKMCNGLKWLSIYASPITTLPSGTEFISGFTPDAIYKPCIVYNTTSGTTRFVRIWVNNLGQMMVGDTIATDDILIYNDVIR